MKSHGSIHTARHGLFGTFLSCLTYKRGTLLPLLAPFLNHSHISVYDGKFFVLQHKAAIDSLGISRPLTTHTDKLKSDLRLAPALCLQLGLYLKNTLY